MLNSPDPEILNSIVRRVFRVDSITMGDNRRYIVRYGGALLMDSAAAYERLAVDLDPFNITPLFRKEDGGEIIYLTAGVIRPKPSRLSVNIGLFILTIISVLMAGVMYGYDGPLPEDTLGILKTLILNLWRGWPFAVSLLGILSAHEFGHYFAGRYHRTAVSLPYFIPFPLSLLGTMGAFINMKERPRNKRVLFDIGITGPLAGLIVAIPVLIIGLSLSKVGKVQDTVYQTAEGVQYSAPDDDLMEGNSLLYLGLKYAVKGKLLPEPASYGSKSPLGYWLGYLVVGKPIPVGGDDIQLHPVAMAGWAGILVTFLNLVPAGQLDGGHILYAVFGRGIRHVWKIVLVILAVMGVFWNGWFIWAALIFLLGRTQAEPPDQVTELDPPRKALALLMLVMFVLVLTPVPFTVF